MFFKIVEFINWTWTCGALLYHNITKVFFVVHTWYRNLFEYLKQYKKSNVSCTYEMSKEIEKNSHRFIRAICNMPQALSTAKWNISRFVLPYYEERNFFSLYICCSFWITWVNENGTVSFIFILQNTLLTTFIEIKYINDMCTEIWWWFISCANSFSRGWTFDKRIYSYSHWNWYFLEILHVSTQTFSDLQGSVKFSWKTIKH